MKEMNHNTEPTSVEIPNLWTLFINDSKSLCLLNHSIENDRINDFKEILEYWLNLSNNFIKCIKKTMKLHKRTIPIMLHKGFYSKKSRSQLLRKYEWLTQSSLADNEIKLTIKK